MSASQLPTVSICLLLALSGPAWAQPAPAATLDERVTSQITPGAGLTADEAARRARGASLELTAQRHETAAAHAVVDQARAGYIPRLSVTARYTRLSDLEQPTVMGFSFPVLLDQLVFQAALVVPVSDYLLRVPAAVGSAGQAARAAELNESAATQRVDTDARAAYYNWVRARLTVTVAEQSVEQARAHLVDARRLFDVGNANRADVLRVESTVSQAELAVVRARNGAELAEASLRTAMRDTSGASYTIGEDVLGELPADEGELEALVERAYAGRPELRGLDASAAAVRGQGKVTRAAYLPRLDLVAGVQMSNPNPRVFPQEDEFRSSWEAGAVLTWTPSDIPVTRAALRESSARAASLEAQRAALADGIRLEVLAALQAVNEARAAIAATTQTLTTAAEAYRVRRALFQNGRATSLELTDAELELTRARLESINAHVDLRVARARLGRATGTL